MANTKIKTETVRERFFNGRQSVEFEGIYKIGDSKIKVRIDVDSYDFQSSATASIFNFDKLEWNNLTRIPYSNMKSCREVFYQRKVGGEQGSGLRASEMNAIRADINLLIKQSREVLL